MRNGSLMDLLNADDLGEGSLHRLWRSMGDEKVH